MYKGRGRDRKESEIKMTMVIVSRYQRVTNKVIVSMYLRMN